MTEDERSFEGLSMIYVGEDEGDEDSGCYVNMHELIAVLRCEALLARVQRGDGLIESVDECLDALADGFAEQAVALMEAADECGFRDDG